MVYRGTKGGEDKIMKKKKVGILTLTIMAIAVISITAVWLCSDRETIMKRTDKGVLVNLNTWEILDEVEVELDGKIKFDTQITNRMSTFNGNFSVKYLNSLSEKQNYQEVSILYGSFHGKWDTRRLGGITYINDGKMDIAGAIYSYDKNMNQLVLQLEDQKNEHNKAKGINTCIVVPATNKEEAQKIYKVTAKTNMGLNYSKNVYNSDATPNAGRVYSFYERLYEDEYVSKLNINYELYKKAVETSNTSEVVAKYIHTYQKNTGNISINASPSGVGGGFSLSGCEKQWSIVCTLIWYNSRIIWRCNYTVLFSSYVIDFKVIIFYRSYISAAIVYNNILDCIIINKSPSNPFIS